jgi:lysophospholipase L1-like esterase
MATSVKNKTLRILCFGDSLTHGFGFGKQPHPYSNVLRERLAKALPGVKLDIVTDGLPGALASTSGFQRRLKTACKLPLPTSPAFRLWLWKAGPPSSTMEPDEPLLFS